MQPLRESSPFAPRLGAVGVLATTAGLLGGFTPVRLTRQLSLSKLTAKPKPPIGGRAPPRSDVRRELSRTRLD